MGYDEEDIIEIREHLGQFTALSPEFQEIVQRQNAWNEPDFLPTVIYGEIGGRIGYDFDIYDEEKKRVIFMLIEQELTSSGAALDNAVATGLIEALGNVSIRNGTWDRVKNYLGPESRGYADAWFGK